MQLVLPDEEAILFPTQTEHEADPDDAANLPFGQSVQIVAPVADVLPGTHERQRREPASGANCPAEHGVQDDDPSAANVPAAHDANVLSDATTYPAGIATQFVAPSPL